MTNISVTKIILLKICKSGLLLNIRERDFLNKKKYNEIPAANAQNLSIIVSVTEYFSARYLERPSCVAKTRVAISMRAMPNLTLGPVNYDATADMDKTPDLSVIQNSPVSEVLMENSSDTNIGLSALYLKYCNLPSNL